MLKQTHWRLRVVCPHCSGGTPTRLYYSHFFIHGNLSKTMSRFYILSLLKWHFGKHVTFFAYYLKLEVCWSTFRLDLNQIDVNIFQMLWPLWTCRHNKAQKELHKKTSYKGCYFKWISYVISNWLATVPPANQMPGWKKSSKLTCKYLREIGHIWIMSTLLTT